MNKRPRCVEEDGGEDDSGDEGSMVRRSGTQIYFHCEVSRKTVLQLVLKLREARNEATVSGSGEVTLFIHSEGGDVYAGLSAMAHIKRCSLPVTTVVDGFVASAASFILLAGARRRMCPYGNVLIHQIRSGFWGKYADMLDEMKNAKGVMKSLKRVYREHTTMDADTIKRVLSQEVTLDAKKCLEFSIVTEIV